MFGGVVGIGRNVSEVPSLAQRVWTVGWWEKRAKNIFARNGGWILFFQKIKVSALSHSSPKKKHPTHCFTSTCNSSSIVTALYAKAAVIADHLPQRHRSASPKNDDAPRNSSRIFHSIGIPRCNYQRRCFIWVLCSNPMPYSKHC